MPKLIIVAGPNGAGKTSFARELLAAAPGSFAFVNADEIARALRVGDEPIASIDIAAARIMLERLDALTAASFDLIFETTLATLTYRRKIPIWQSAGYSVGLLYLRLPNVEASITRVARRVAAGGHDIPAATIRQRFNRSLDYLERYYKPIVDEWYVCDSQEGRVELAQSWSRS